VERRQAHEATQDVVDVRAEHAAIDVQLVEHDEAQARQEAGPVGVMREDPACSMSGFVIRTSAGSSLILRRA
jgi:hypothetical protein